MINEAFIDRWTAVHALTGLGVGALGISAPVAIAGAAAYEIIEYAHEWPRGSTFFGSKRPESIPNIVTDLLVFGAGYWLTSRREPGGAIAALSLGAAALLAYAFVPDRMKGR